MDEYGVFLDDIDPAQIRVGFTVNQGTETI